MTIENKVRTNGSITLSEEFGKFLDSYLEEQRLCFYTMKKYNQDDAPVDVLANKALSYEEFGLPVFLKKFDLEDNIENLAKLTDSFVNFVEACKLNLQHFNSFKEIDRDVWGNEKFDGLYDKNSNITFLNFDKLC